MTRRIFNREFSVACGPKGDAMCDGYDDDDESCECPCHDGSDSSFDVETTEDMQEAHEAMWNGVTL